MMTTTEIRENEKLNRHIKTIIYRFRIDYVLHQSQFHTLFSEQSKHIFSLEHKFANFLFGTKLNNTAYGDRNIQSSSLCRSQNQNENKFSKN